MDKCIVSWGRAVDQDCKGPAAILSDWHTQPLSEQSYWILPPSQGMSGHAVLLWVLTLKVSSAWLPLGASSESFPALGFILQHVAMTPRSVLLHPCCSLASPRLPELQAPPGRIPHLHSHCPSAVLEVARAKFLVLFTTPSYQPAVPTKCGHRSSLRAIASAGSLTWNALPILH